MDDLIIVCLFVLDFFLLRDQFFDDIGEILRQCLSDFGAGVFGRDTFDDLYQTMKGYFVPVLQIVLFSFHDLQFALWIIDQGCQAFFVLVADGVPEFLVDLAAYGTGTVFQDMVELFVFSVDIRQEMFRTFGEVQDGLEVDDLCGGCRYIFVLV